MFSKVTCQLFIFARSIPNKTKPYFAIFTPELKKKISLKNRRNSFLKKFISMSNNFYF